MKNKKSVKGITLIALVVTIVVLLILAGVSIAMLAGEAGIIRQAQNAKEENIVGEEKDAITLAYNGAKTDNLGKKVTAVDLNKQFTNNGTGATAEGEGKITITFSKTGNVYTIDENGKIAQQEEQAGGDDTIVADDLGILPQINAEEMTPVKYNEATGEWVKADTSVKGDWFDYSTSAKKWANVETENGYFVYIPRFAYKITSGYHQTLDTAGTMEVVFLNGDNTLKTSTDSEGNTVSQSDLIHASEVTSSVDETNNEVKTGKNATTNYIIHPAFEAFDTAEKKVDGLWVAKYEMSMEQTIDGGTTWETVITDSKDIGNVSIVSDTTKRMVSKPGVSSWRLINVSNIFDNCYNMNRELDSHMMKNTEWGAVAYLTVSKYGKGATSEVEQNNARDITGCGADSTLSTGAASTTGTMYGVFDMSGGAYEYVAGYLESTYQIPTDLENAEEKYKDLYIGDYEDEIYINYRSNKLKVGDALWEISSDTSGDDSWFNDYQCYVGIERVEDCVDAYDVYHLFVRGGFYYLSDTKSGVFSADSHNGGISVYNSFRVVCVVQ